MQKWRMFRIDIMKLKPLNDSEVLEMSLCWLFKYKSMTAVALMFVILFVSASDEELIFRSFDGDVLKVNTHSNETEILMKNTTFVRFFFIQEFLMC